jgi:putative tributyrin esterase
MLRRERSDVTDTIQPMAHLRCDFFSETLALSTSMTVILPQATSTQIGMTGQAGTEPPPVLYLLHGLSDDHTIWLRRTSIERYVAPLGLAVVMPQVHRSFYLDEVYGGRYWTFLSEELPAVVASFFRVSTRPEDTFVAGLSMGGYGALRWALKQPMRVGAAVSLSGAVNVAGLRTGRVRAEDPRLFERVFGSGEVAGSEHDLFALLDRTPAAELPPLYLCCGTEDPLYPDNRAFETACARAGVPLTTRFTPGEHDWAYWDAEIQQVLDWLPIQPSAAIPRPGGRLAN